MKYIKNIYLVLLLLAIGLSSCEDYLDRPVDADVEDEDVWKSFNSYQGFVENIYQCVVDGMNRNDNGFSDGGNFGDELVGGNPSWMVDFDDNCAYYYWEGAIQSQFFSGDNPPKTGNDPGNYNGRIRKGYWDHGWLGIRMANMALAHIDEMVEPYEGGGTLEEQRNIIEGQALFFRAYFHFEIIRTWGGMPYVEEFYDPNNLPLLQRLDYHTTTDKIAADLIAAAELLPNDWDKIPIGNVTYGNNRGRVTKGAALGYLGKAYLYAGSPLMNGTVTGNYNYNEEYCKLAAKAFNELFKLVDQGVYSLVPWENYYDNFWKYDGTTPLTEETIFNNPIYGPSRWHFGGWSLGYLGGYTHFRSPTQNYVKYYGMANGLPTDEADSGYDPMNPYENRDPRFYKDIITDGEQIAAGQSAESAGDVYAQFYIGGRHRGVDNSISGYGWRKYAPREVNKYEDTYNTESRLFRQNAEMRLSDAYLMYAEAVNEAYGPNIVPADIPGAMTAVEAVNKVRERANVPAVDNRFLSSKEGFRELVKKERAVELAFEGHRWYDLRRWYVAHLPQYTQKWVLDFDKDHTYFTERLYLTKPFEMKHYWLPLPVGQTTIYPEFQQNPGW